MPAPNLKDSQGEDIFSSKTHWYKIVLADGSELGLGEKFPTSDSPDRRFVEIVPAGRGLLVRYQHKETEEGEYGWQEGEAGYLRGLHAEPDEEDLVKNFSLTGSGDHPGYLCLYQAIHNYGIVAYQLRGNRIALYANDYQGKLRGLSVTAKKNIARHVSEHAKALDVSFVKVSSPAFSGYF